MIKHQRGQPVSTVGQREILAQQRVAEFFQDALGYAYLGHWNDRAGNSNVEEKLLTSWLKREGRFRGIPILLLSHF